MISVFLYGKVLNAGQVGLQESCSLQFAVVETDLRNLETEVTVKFVIVSWVFLK